MIKLLKRLLGLNPIDSCMDDKNTLQANAIVNHIMMAEYGSTARIKR